MQISKIYRSKNYWLAFGIMLLSHTSLHAAPKNLWKEGDGKKPVVSGLDEGVFKLNQAFTVLAEKLSSSVVSIATRTQIENSPQFD